MRSLPDESERWIARSSQAAASVPGVGGLRERLLLLGGTLTAGRRDGQWIVTAQVPR
jgi:signal transduction histidine kinase